MIDTYLSILRRRLLPFLVLSAALAPLLYLALTSGEDQYRSIAVVEVGTGGVAESLLGQGGAYVEPERRMATELELLRSPEVAERTAARLSSADTVIPRTEVTEHMSATVRRSTNYIEVAGSGSTPSEARALTQAVVETYLEYRRGLRRQELEDLQDELSASLEDAEADLAAAPPDDADSPFSERAAAVERVRSARELVEAVRLRLSIESGGVQLLSQPSLPESPSNPITPPLALVASFLGSMFAAASAIFVGELVRDSVRTRDEARRLVQAPVLGELPAQSRAAGSRTENLLQDPRRRAARTVRIRLATVGQQGLPNKVLVTGLSANGAEVADAATALAASCAEAGSRVLLVTDHMSPWAKLGVERLDRGSEEPGALARAVVAHMRATTATGSGRGLFDQPAPSQALLELTDAYDVVVVALTPAEGVTPEAVADLFDAVLVVCVLGRTRGRSLRRLAEELEESGSAVSGLVLSRPGGRARSLGSTRRRRTQGLDRVGDAAVHTSTDEVGTARAAEEQMRPRVGGRSTPSKTDVAPEDLPAHQLPSRRA